MVNWGSILDWVKTPRLMLVICILSAVLLFMPSPIIARFGLTSFMNSNRHWIALAFLASACLVLVYAGFQFLPPGLKNLTFQHRRKRRAKSLSIVEKRVIQCYIRDGTRTQRFNINSGVLSGLVAFGFLQIAAAGDSASGYAFNITEWAYHYFQKHPQLIDIPRLPPWDTRDGVP